MILSPEKQKREKHKEIIKINNYPHAGCANKTKREQSEMLLLTSLHIGRYHKSIEMGLYGFILFYSSPVKNVSKSQVK